MSEKRLMEKADFAISVQAVKRIETMRRQTLCCRRCGKPILPDRSINHAEVHRTKRPGKTAYYHQACWEAMLV